MSFLSIIAAASTAAESAAESIAETVAETAAEGGAVTSMVPEDFAFDYSMRVAERWQLGSKEHDNGLLMTIAVNDHRIQILTGYGLEGVLPDIVAGRIINNKIIQSLLSFF